MEEAKGTCCGKCGHVHVKGTSCSKPFSTGKNHCSRRTNEMHTMDDDGPIEFHQVYADIEEGLEDAKDNPCWRGYHPVGTKMKDGREVPNCVPTNEGMSLEGLWANINAKKARGEKSSPKGSKAYKAAVAAGNKLDELKYTEGLENTSWTGEDGKKITLQQLLDVIKDHPVIQAPIEKIEKIIIRKNSGGIESDRLSAADIKYPIIIVTDDSGNYKYILDGNHRANKAIDAELKSVPAKLVNISKLPQEFQDVLGESLNEIDEINEYCPQCLAEYIIENYNKIEEAEYRGRKVSLGKPFLTPGGPKKRSVYVKNAKGNVVKVNFGDPNMRIKKSIPARRKSYRARHHCENPGPRTKANYWSCRAW